MPIKFSVEDEYLRPSKANPGDAGWDLRASEDTLIRPGFRSLVPTGAAVELPDGTAGFIWPRSGLAVKHGIDVLAGLIDSGYRGEIKVALVNHGAEAFVIERGDRIAQLVVAPINTDEAEFVDELNDSERSDKGFGSSGVS